MSLAFKNALMPSENQKVLRLRLSSFMPKIIKTVSADAIYNNGPEYVIDSGKYFGEYNSLSDNGDIYIIRGDSDVREWWAYRCIAPTVSEKSNFFKMLAGSNPTGEQSEVFKTKKALTKAIEEGTAGFAPWKKIPREFNQSDIYSSYQKGDSDIATTEEILELGRQMEKESNARERRNDSDQIEVPFTFPSWYIPLVLLLLFVGSIGLAVGSFGVVLTVLLTGLIVGWIVKKPTRNK